MGEIIPQKQCSHCKELFLSTDEFFHRDKGKRDGLSSRCKTCARAIAKQWADENPEQNRRRSNDWYYANPERAKNTRKTNYDLNADQRRAKSREWHHSHPEHIRIRKRDYRKRNADLINQSNRDWRSKHPEQGRAATLSRQARVRGAVGRITAADRKWLHDEQEGRCFYCGITLFPSVLRDCHVDHVLPPQKGGTNYRDNLRMACGHCNASKGDKSLAVWQAVRGW